MRDLITVYLPWLLSLLTVLMMHMAGDRSPRAWLVGLVNQALWLVWIVASASWGLVPMNLLMWWVCWRNHRKWSKP